MGQAYSAELAFDELEYHTPSVHCSTYTRITLPPLSVPCDLPVVICNTSVFVGDQYFPGTENQRSGKRGRQNFRKERKERRPIKVIQERKKGIFKNRNFCDLEMILRILQNCSSFFLS